jgi:hypothetical protein
LTPCASNPSNTEALLSPTLPSFDLDYDDGEEEDEELESSNDEVSPIMRVQTPQDKTESKPRAMNHEHDHRSRKNMIHTLKQDSTTTKAKRHRTIRSNTISGPHEAFALSTSFPSFSRASREECQHMMLRMLYSPPLSSSSFLGDTACGNHDHSRANSNVHAPPPLRHSLLDHPSTTTTQHGMPPKKNRVFEHFFIAGKRTVSSPRSSMMNDSCTGTDDDVTQEQKQALPSAFSTPHVLFQYPPAVCITKNKKLTSS